MSEPVTLGNVLSQRGVSRRSFLKFCTVMTSALGLPAEAATQMADALAHARRQSVIWLSFQECTGCTESLTRSHSPTLENLIFDFISLDYHHTLQAASGHAAEEARAQAMREHEGKYLVVVDGSIATKDDGVYSTIAGITNLEMLRETARGAAALVAVGTCAAFGGLPRAKPNPTGAMAVDEIITDKPVVNVPGCPPIPVVITGVLAHVLTFDTIPELDQRRRPKAFFGETIHDRCYRRPFYDQGKFARGFDDEGARRGWCLYELGCKGPTTYNACATVKWNGGTSFPIQSGSPCLGCSEPRFWDQGGFYQALSQGTWSSAEGIAAAAGVGVALGVGAAKLSKRHMDGIVDEYGEQSGGGSMT